MFNDAENVLALIRPADRVLDIGGAIEVFPRANAVIDILPYETRQPGQLKDMSEQFSRDDWHIGDICYPEIWEQFKDKEFDFVLCSHVLEDIRDPVFVCSQMVRVGKAGYIEIPSRFRECSKTTPDDLCSGWEHHRWIVDVEGGSVIFKAKLPWMDAFDYLGNEHRQLLADWHHQFTAIHWNESFDFLEHGSKGRSPVEVEDIFYYFKNYPFNEPRPFHEINNIPQRGRTFEWIYDYRLPVEDAYSIEEILVRYNARLKSIQKHGEVRSRRFAGLRSLLNRVRYLVR